MLESDGLYRLAASNFYQAGRHLADTEAQLIKLRARLDKCLKLVRQVPQEDVLWQQVDVIVNGNSAGTAAATNPVR